MWQTPLGTRKLEGAERRLFLDEVLRMTSGIEDPDHDVIVEILQHLNIADRRHAFLSVAHHLTNGSLAPRLFAWSDAVVEEIFDGIRAQVGMEVDAQQRFPGEIDAYTRNQVRAALKEAFPGERGIAPSLRSTDLERWESVVMLLRMRVLGGTTHLKYHQIADLPPAKAARKRKQWKVDEDYFSALPPLFSEDVRKALDVFEQNTKEEMDGLFEEYERKSKKKSAK